MMLFSPQRPATGVFAVYTCLFGAMNSLSLLVFGIKAPTPLLVVLPIFLGEAVFGYRLMQRCKKAIREDTPMNRRDLFWLISILCLMCIAQYLIFRNVDRVLHDENTINNALTLSALAICYLILLLISFLPLMLERRRHSSKPKSRTWRS